MVTTFHLFGHLGLSSGVHGCKKASTVLLLHRTAPIPMETFWPPTTRSIRHHERGILSLSAGCSRGSLGFRVTKSWQKNYDGPNIKGCLLIQLPLIFEIWSFEHGSSLLHISPSLSTLALPVVPTWSMCWLTKGERNELFLTWTLPSGIVCTKLTLFKL